MGRTLLGNVKGDNGKSAYQIWLDLGNVGTEQNFLDSLKVPSKQIFDKTSERVLGITYTNEGNDKYLQLICEFPNGANYINVTVGDKIYQIGNVSTTSTYRADVYLFYIPSGLTYKVQKQGNLNTFKWYEII